MSQLATQLQNTIGKSGFQKQNIWNMTQFAREYPNVLILQQAAPKLPWRTSRPFAKAKEQNFPTALDDSFKWSIKFDTSVRDFKAITHQAIVKETCQTLQPIVESGTYTPLANELKKLSQKFFNKREITTSQVDNLLIALAKKYDAFTSEEEETKLEEIDTNIAPEIVLSETFID